MTATFNFENFKRSFDYINNSDKISLGNGYSFVAKPRGPLLKTFHITMKGMRYYFTQNGEIDNVTNATKDNLGALCKFYEQVGTYDKFIFHDEQFGDVMVRFLEPLKPGDTVGRKAVVETITFDLGEVCD